MPLTTRLSRRAWLGAALACAGMFAAASPVPAWAQAAAAWPDKPLRLIVGYPPGSSPDVQARLLSEPLAKALGQPVVVENRPGASGNIGADQLAKAKDGHTIGIIGNGPLTSSPYLYTRLPYDPAKDFAPIALIGTSPLVWVVPAGSMPGDAARYLDEARQAGDKLAYGSIGAGSGGHLGMEILKPAFGIDPLHVPYAGGPAIITDILGGQLQMAMLPTSTVAPLLQSGKLKAVAVTSAERSPLAPDVPAMREVGAPDVNIEVWNAVMAPAAMPQAHRDTLSRALADILQAPEVRQKLFQQGWNVGDVSAQALAQRITADSRLYGELIQARGIQLD